MNAQRHINSLITAVAEGSPAQLAGLRPNDELVSINGNKIRDVLDYRFHSADERVTVTVRRNGRELTRSLRKNVDEDLGLEFAEELFDGVHRCVNDCLFCFLRQMPEGMRSSLYVRDDDFRLSFAHGNYITLTNLSDREMERIRSQRMSPLYVSVHATEPDLRAHLFGNRHAGRIMEQLRRLADARIAVHAQIVLCPGINDGEHLERTVRDLTELHPSVASVAIVPVGLTRHREGLPVLRCVDADVAREVVGACDAWQAEFRSRFGTRLVYASDEFYILAGRVFPSARSYEGFPQLEDGVGLSRIFLDDLRRAARRIGDISPQGGRYVLVTGTLASGMVQRLADVLVGVSGIDARVCAVRNRFFGESVTVAGLLTGRDIADALSDLDPSEVVLIPSIALKDGRFLDDMTLDGLSREVGACVRAVEPSPGAVIRILGVGAKTTETEV